MHVSCKSGSSNPWISIRSWDPRFDTPVLEKGGLLAAIEEGGPVLNWPLADNEIMEAKPMLSTNPRKSTAESLRKWFWSSDRNRVESWEEFNAFTLLPSP
ncbi:hypothetical protein KXW40_008825 [Aspergillus fumigatus]|nr:hypothetical protein KXW40_008825 [Aspergillus fumigatus]